MPFDAAIARIIFDTVAGATATRFEHDPRTGSRKLALQLEEAKIRLLVVTAILQLLKKGGGVAPSDAMDGQEYREKLLVHAKKRGYERPSRQGNDWIFKAATGARAIVEFEPVFTEKSGYLTYAKTTLTAIQNEAMGKWPERVAARLHAKYAKAHQQTRSAGEEGSQHRVRRLHPTICPNDFTRYAEELPGEDRSFGGNEFYVEGLPRSSWFKNLRSMMPLRQWKALGVYVRDRAGNRCEICGSSNRLEAHERWKFDERTKTQRLVRIMCLCKECHLGVHLGLASTLGIRSRIEEHIISITGWSKKELSDRLAASVMTGPTTDWRLDVSIVAACGATIDDPTRMVAIKERQLLKEAQIRSIDLGGTSTGRLDLSTEIRQGMVVFLSYDDSNIFGGVDLSDTIPYTAQTLNNLPSGTVSIPLKLFVMAHNNPIVVWNEHELGDILKDRTSPKRLIVRSSWVDEDLVGDCLKDAILFSFS
jgi:hypothetical protein